VVAKAEPELKPNYTVAVVPAEKPAVVVAKAEPELKPNYTVAVVPAEKPAVVVAKAEPKLKPNYQITQIDNPPSENNGKVKLPDFAVDQTDKKSRI